MAWPDVSCRPLALLYLRIELADCYAQLGARFEHLGARADQSEVLIIGDLDQPVENRVVKHLPPVSILLISRIDRRVLGFEPFLGNRGRRRGKIRADETSGAAKRQQHAQPSATPQSRGQRLPSSGAAKKHSPPGEKKMASYFAGRSLSLRETPAQGLIDESEVFPIRGFTDRPAERQSNRRVVVTGASGAGPLEHDLDPAILRPALRRTVWRDRVRFAEPFGRQDVGVDPLRP